MKNLYTMLTLRQLLEGHSIDENGIENWVHFELKSEIQLLGREKGPNFALENTELNVLVHLPSTKQLQVSTT